MTQTASETQCRVGTWENTDRQYTLTQWSTNLCSIQPSKHIMRISDTRDLCNFISAQSSTPNRSAYLTHT